MILALFYINLDIAVTVDFFFFKFFKELMSVALLNLKLLHSRAKKSKYFCIPKLQTPRVILKIPKSPHEIGFSKEHSAMRPKKLESAAHTKVAIQILNINRHMRCIVYSVYINQGLGSCSSYLSEKLHYMQERRKSSAIKLSF